MDLPCSSSFAPPSSLAVSVSVLMVRKSMQSSGLPWVSTQEFRVTVQSISIGVMADHLVGSCGIPPFVQEIIAF